MASRQANARRNGSRWFGHGISDIGHRCVGHNLNGRPSIWPGKLLVASIRRSGMKTARSKRPARGPARGPAKRGVLGSNVLSVKSKIASYGVRQALENLALSENFPASARVTAARTLAEIDGMIGRHQVVPERQAEPVHSLSRDALVAELERLRTLVDLGLLA
jgi:hypothetical protein